MNPRDNFNIDELNIDVKPLEDHMVDIKSLRQIESVFIKNLEDGDRLCKSMKGKSNVNYYNTDNHIFGITQL